jgi:DNA modification methylase
LKRYEENLK